MPFIHNRSVHHATRVSNALGICVLLVSCLSAQSKMPPPIDGRAKKFLVMWLRSSTCHRVLEQRLKVTNRCSFKMYFNASRARNRWAPTGWNRPATPYHTRSAAAPPTATAAKAHPHTPNLHRGSSLRARRPQLGAGGGLGRYATISWLSGVLDGASHNSCIEIWALPLGATTLHRCFNSVVRFPGLHPKCVK